MLIILKKIILLTDQNKKELERQYFSLDQRKINFYLLKIFLETFPINATKKIMKQE